MNKKFINQSAQDELIAYITMDKNINKNHDEVLALPAIFHYTSPNAFMSIMQNSKIWFTDSHFLNDIEEEYHIKDIIKIIIEKYSSKYKNDVINVLNKYISTERLDNKNYKRYVFSCSLAGDELSLWNYYSKKNSLGYSLAFNPKDLYKSFCEQNENCISLYKCIYDDDEKLNYLVNILDLADKALDARAFQNKQKNTVLDLLEENISILSIIFKNKIFSTEKEIRFIHNNHNDKSVNYRLLNGILIPYIEIDFDRKQVLQSIMIGPGSQDEIILYGAKEFVSTLGLNVNIRDSQIPCRKNWNN